MSEGQIVFAVVSGEYSDYRVHCIFERKDDAHAYLMAQGYTRNPRRATYETHQWQKGPYDYCGIEEFQFWPAGVVPHVAA